MGLEFRRRDYKAEQKAHSLPRAPADTHPLSAPAPSPSLQVEERNEEGSDFFDPLRAVGYKLEVPVEDMQSGDVDLAPTSSSGLSDQSRVKEWSSFTKILMQRFPLSKTIPISMVSGVSVKSNKGSEKSTRDLNPEELDDDDRFAEDDVKLSSQQEYAVKLRQLKDEIRQSWNADDRVASLRLSIKVARLLMNTSAIQSYPTLFVLATDAMDMLGDLVWKRIKQKAEFAEDGRPICTLPDNFGADVICFDAKETCNNWFSKISSVPELLPRIYLELAILPCWRFILDHPQDTLQRLVLMMRGIADPLASIYCRLYMVHRAQRLLRLDRGYLIICISDLKVPLTRLISVKESKDGNISANSGFLLTLIEPAIEYIIKCLFKDLKQTEISNVLVALEMGSNPSTLFENCACISIILHHILKELPIGFTCSHALEILHLIERSNDCSFEQFLNFKLLGVRLCEKIPEVSNVHLLVDKIIQVLSCYKDLNAYLVIAEAYLDFIFEGQLTAFINIILDGIFERAREREIGDNELVTLQSIFVKLLAHFGGLENLILLNHFVDILDLMHGSSRNAINMHILRIATRKARIQDPTFIELLFEVAQSLYDGVDFSNMRKEEYQHPASVICRFVFKVDFGIQFESHLRFLAQCRAAFAGISELQDILIHSSNNLAIRAMRYGIPNLSFVKSCLAFNEATIPAIPSDQRQLNLYLETAEVALLGGFTSHMDGLIDAAVNCLCNFDSIEGLRIPEDVDWLGSLICKLCGILVMVPGNPERGVTCILNHLLCFLDSQPWVLPRTRTTMLSAVIYLSAALSQNPLLYHATGQEALGNDRLFFGVPSYPQELQSLSGSVLQSIVTAIMQEPSTAVRGKIALEACNCVASSFLMRSEALEACSKLVAIAKTCLKVNDKFLQSTLKFLDSRQFVLSNIGEAM